MISCDTHSDDKDNNNVFDNKNANDSHNIERKDHSDDADNDKNNK